jgi:hypothetical protein
MLKERDADVSCFACAELAVIGSFLALKNEEIPHSLPISIGTYLVVGVVRSS